MTIREAVARAMYEKNAAAATGRQSWDKATVQVREHFCALADVAIEEMENSMYKFSKQKLTHDQKDEKLAQAYQVIAALLALHGNGDSDDERTLDYFASDEFDPDFLPWAMQE